VFILSYLSTGIGPSVLDKGGKNRICLVLSAEEFYLFASDCRKSNPITGLVGEYLDRKAYSEQQSHPIAASVAARSWQAMRPKTRGG
jgi:hypothetical protein